RLLVAGAVRIGEFCLGTRYRSNPLLRRMIGAARWISYWAAVRAHGGFPKARRLLVLCYHAITDQSADPVLAPFGVPPPRFLEHLASLRGRGFVFVGPEAMAAFLYDGALMPRRAVLLTFDDCYHDLLGVARNVLRPSGIEALAFAVTNLASGTNEWDQPHGAVRTALLDPQQLRELASLGVEVGAHSRTHRAMPQLSDRDRAIEASGARSDLASLGLPEPRFFAYPYGATDDPTIAAVRAAGYVGGFAVASRWADLASDPFRIPRVAIMANDKGWRFRFKTTSPRLFGWVNARIQRFFRIFRNAAQPSLA
ncbi:MAG: polysaccharide deacetylase family protein, partial [Sphingomicrobium sp.]